MTLEEQSFIDVVRTLAYEGRVAEVAEATYDRLVPAIDGEVSRDFLAILFDLTCRAVLSLHGHTPMAKGIVRTLCGLSLRTHGPQPWTFLYTACLSHLEGAHDRAVELYLKAGPEAGLLWPTSVGCRSVATLDFARRAAMTDNSRARLDIVREGRRGGTIAVVTSADHVYLRRHGDAFMRSALNYAAGQTIHLHLINPEPNDAQFIEDMIEGGLWPDLNVSVETYAGEDRKAFYATVRLMCAFEIMSRYDLPMMISDIDARLTAVVAGSTPMLDKVDAGLRIKDRGFRAHPWQAVQAGVFVMTPTKEGKIFSAKVSRLAVELFTQRKGQEIWFIDQNILFLAHFLVTRGYLETKILNLTEAGLPGQISFG